MLGLWNSNKSTRARIPRVRSSLKDRGGGGPRRPMVELLRRSALLWACLVVTPLACVKLEPRNQFASEFVDLFTSSEETSDAWDGTDVAEGPDAEAKCGDGECNGDESVPTCPSDCAFLAKHLGGKCTVPGSRDTCANGFVCVGRGAAGGGNVCVADFETWQPTPDDHPTADFKEEAEFVVDNKTGLSWAKATLDPTDWTTALKGCTAAKYGTFTDWRLPTVGELTSLLDRNKAYPASSGPQLNWPSENWEFWTSVPWTLSGSAWMVNFGTGTAYMSSKYLLGVARCVR